MLYRIGCICCYNVEFRNDWRIPCAPCAENEKLQVPTPDWQPRSLLAVPLTGQASQRTYSKAGACNTDGCPACVAAAHSTKPSCCSIVNGKGHGVHRAAFATHLPSSCRHSVVAASIPINTAAVATYEHSQPLLLMEPRPARPVLRVPEISSPLAHHLYVSRIFGHGLRRAIPSQCYYCELLAVRSALLA